MPTDAKPLFRLDALRPKLNAFAPASAVASARPKLANWTDLLSSKAAEKMKETELLGDFIRDVFGDLLGYIGPASGSPVYTLKRESLVQVDGKFADAALGRFTLADGQADFVLVIEGKGPRDPLDRPFGSRKRSAVEQALQYAVNLQIDWFLVTNMKEIRLFHKGHDLFTYERFDTNALAHDDAALKRFAYLLGAERVIPAAGGTHLDALLADSRRIGRELTNDYYHEYATLRRQTFNELRRANPDIAPAELLAVAQKILDRVLFIAFSEDRGLLPAKSIANAFRHADPYNPRPIWDNFRGLFRAIDEGNQALAISRYNGGLFALDEQLEKLRVPDVICKGFDKLAAYEYGKDADNPHAKMIDVEILGHIFEQSISDLEELHQQITAPAAADAEPTKAGPSKRKKEGAFYTPAFVTRYIVAETLQPILAERFETLRRQYEDDAKAGAKKLFADPRAYDLRELTGPQRKALADFWNAWLDTLATVRIVDPACGSGAFLLEAFDQMHAQYQQANARLTELVNQQLFADVDKQILQSNLFGMDLNSEAIEICRLSLWIKTAETGKVLTSLDENIRLGNSVIADAGVHPLAADWKKAFPVVFEAGGFDVVIGNPPYVRQEWIAPYKEYWKTAYKSFDSIADLYVYFFELGLRILRIGGRMGYITSGSWVRGNFGEGLRGLFANSARVEAMIDFGEYQPFEDAEMIRPTIAILSKGQSGAPMRLFKWLTTGKPPENLSEAIRAAPSMRTDHLGKEAWELEADDVIALRRQLSDRGNKLGEFVSGKIFRGVVTGLNEIFVISADQRNHLLAADPNSADLIKPFVQGTNLRPWYIEQSGEYLIFTRRGTRLDDYPAVREYLEQFRKQLAPKPDDWPQSKKWEGRKPGSYQWFEIQDTVDFWQSFEKPKIMWPDISKLPRFSYDTEKRFLGNTAFCIPTDDFFLLGVLNSWATWFFISKTAQPLRLRGNRWQYRLFTQYTENIPIPNASAGDRTEIGRLAELCTTLGNQRYQAESKVQSRLAQAFGTGDKGELRGKLNEKAHDWWDHSLKSLGAALKQSFKLSRDPFANPKTADEWDSYLAEKRQEVDTLRQRLAEAEAEINDRVYELFALTPDEIRLLKREVEH